MLLWSTAGELRATVRVNGADRIVAAPFGRTSPNSSTLTALLAAPLAAVRASDVRGFPLAPLAPREVRFTGGRGGARASADRRG